MAGGDDGGRWVPSGIDELSQRWVELRYEEPDATPRWLRPVVGPLGVVIAVLVRGLLTLLVPIGLAVGAVIAGLMGLWWLSLVLVVLVPLLMLLIRESFQAVLLARKGVRVVQASRTTTFAWDSVAFGVEDAAVLGADRTLLVISDGRRTVRFRGYGEFIQRRTELPMVAAHLNGLARAARSFPLEGE